MNDKKAFIKTFLPESVTDLQLVHIDLDQTGLTLCDILRNINKVFPINSRDRHEMMDGHKVIAAICRSDLLEPIHGIIIIVSHDIDIKTESKKYILITVDEEDIRNEDDLDEINDAIFTYLMETIREGVLNFNEFYLKHIYNDYELEKLEEDN